VTGVVEKAGGGAVDGNGAGVGGRVLGITGVQAEGFKFHGVGWL
jgi:hypothetical protein